MRALRDRLRVKPRQQAIVDGTVPMSRAEVAKRVSGLARVVMAMAGSAFRPYCRLLSESIVCAGHRWSRSSKPRKSRMSPRRQSQWMKRSFCQNQHLQHQKSPATRDKRWGRQRRRLPTIGGNGTTRRRLSETRLVFVLPKVSRTTTAPFDTWNETPYFNDNPPDSVREHPDDQ